MNTLLVDTNVVLRFLTNDIPSQAKKVEKRFKTAQEGKISLRILPIVVIEIIFHLEHWYKFKKVDACEKIKMLFSPTWMQLDEKVAIFESLEIYKTSNIDFVDLILWCIAKKDKQKILSFDKDYDKLSPKLRTTP